MSEPLHSLNASPLQADCSAADGLKPANAALISIGEKPTAAIVPFRIVFDVASRNSLSGLFHQWGTSGRRRAPARFFGYLFASERNCIRAGTIAMVTHCKV